MTLREIGRRVRHGLIYLGPRRDVTVETYNGLLTFDSKDWLIGKQLYVRRAYEAEEIERAIALLKREGYVQDGGRGTVLDVGANLGMICIALVKQGHFARALAFEPAPESFRLLVKNIEQNGLSGRIRPFPFALSAEEGERELELSEDNSGDHRLRVACERGAFREERRRTLKVTVKTLDQLLAAEPALQAERLALVWLDIQGHEGHFFLGARKTLSAGVPVVAEFWPYAIARSGISRPEYCRIASDLFTHFFLPFGESFRKHPIGELNGLFDVYASPKEMCLLVFVRGHYAPRPTRKVNSVK